ncbi:hypothetical protein [Lentzea guizhouensis]|nr:hypothetical protein [Lentzea guizhouensis]
MSKSEQKAGQEVQLPPYFSTMSDEELLSWYAELQARAMSPQPGDVDFDHVHKAAEAMTVEQLRHRLLTFQGWPGGSGMSTMDAGSPFHNLWHWLSD